MTTTNVDRLLNDTIGPAIVSFSTNHSKLGELLEVIRSALSQARQEGREEGIRQSAKIASEFSLKKIAIHPDINVDSMGDAQKTVYHATAQCISGEILSALTTEGK